MAAATDMRWNAGKRRVFQSVFQAHTSQPTPYSTPSARFTEPGQPFGGFPSSLASLHTPLRAVDPASRPQLSPSNPHADDQIRFDRSWHVVTSRIALPPSVTVEDSFGPPPGSQDGLDDVFEDALRDVLDSASRLPRAVHTEDILSWHTQQVRMHFVGHVLPLLEVCGGHSDQTQVLLGSIRTLEAAHRQYLYGLSLITRPMGQDDAQRALRKFQRDLHAIVGNSMSTSLMDALRVVLKQLMSVILHRPNHSSDDGQQTNADMQLVQESRREMLQLVESLSKVGLAGERFQILFAELLNDIMITYIHESYAGVWQSQDSRGSTVPTGRKPAKPFCIREISDRIENDYARLAVEVSDHLGISQVAWTDVEKWKEIAIGRLATLRINELFDIVINWPNSEGGIDDLRYAVATPQRRLQLTDAFSAALEKRLLHPGRSTLDILRTYIAMIRTFQKLDHSRVLLDRVAYSLQLYLCTREDTVRIIVNSLLLSPQEATEEARKTKLVELVDLLHEPNQYRVERQDEDWDDLSWSPPPVDAGSNYSRRKSEDVIGTLISALGSPEVFIKEFQNIIGERLLSKQGGFEQEIGVLELLKKRFGESSLQSCDVMIKDIQDSRRLDSVIHRGVMAQPHRFGTEWTISTKILSRLFWPDMGEENFVVPSDIAQMQERYEGIYGHLKPTRKLKWLNHLGKVTIELELEDRTFSEEVRTDQAAVINAFGEAALNGRAASWSYEELWVHLQIDEDILAAALQFWVGKSILRKLPDEQYVVVERLSDIEEASAKPASSAEAGEAATVTSPRKAKPGISEKEKEKRNLYWHFVQSMLTNSAPAMTLPQMSMMMKMLIPEGFPWTNEELQEYLAEKMAEGEIQLVGGKYKLIRK